MSDQTPTDPWRAVRAFGPVFPGDRLHVPRIYDADAVDRARAAEHEQHQREIAQRDETIRQLQAQITTMTQERDLTRGHSTSLCACRAGLPLRDGSAQWWAERPVYRASVSGLMDAAEVVVDTEVPVSADNFPLLTRGNRFWPTLVDLKFDGRTLFLTGDQARELALRLIAAADASDACDRPDTDACGHWAPCDCGKRLS